MCICVYDTMLFVFQIQNQIIEQIELIYFKICMTCCRLIPKYMAHMCVSTHRGRRDELGISITITNFPKYYYVLEKGSPVCSSTT